MKMLNTSRHGRPVPSKAALVLGAAGITLVLAVINQAVAKRSERRHPRRGDIIEIEGVGLHYFEAGSGPPVVLIHGNGVTAEDYVISGLFDRLSANHRVIAFDRPGFGHSQRPRGRIWSAAAQADLIAAALDRLGVTSATAVAHSWGTLVALRLALRRPELVAGLGLMSGYYWPTPRLDVPLMSGPAIPVFGDILRFTLSPLMGWVMTPAVFRQVFSPAKITAKFQAQFPTAMALRPGQIRAAAGDTAMMPFEALSVSRHYRQLAGPVLLIAGDGDKIASFKHQSLRLAQELGCRLHTVEGAGHMVHHTAPDEVGAAVEGLLATVEGSPSHALPRSDREFEDVIR